MTITKSQINEELDWNFWNYAFNLEKEWRKSRLKFTDKELSEIFPEAQKIIPEKIQEWEQERGELVETIKQKLTIIKHTANDEISYWFWREWVKITDGHELFKIDGHIIRLKRLSLVTKHRFTKDYVTEEQIQQALAIPIESLIDQPLRKSGVTLIGLCPFHEEKHPSFYIYPETNSCWCYGCNQGGNTIKLVQLLHGLSFKETIKYLIKM